ncbi:MAG: zinc ribbon domain-containing protein [Candidatus Solibacter sp.]|nr:zinc ribbon domain-containing protein [Candidatus Solibacter sp.]
MTPVVPRQRVIPFGGWLASGIVFLVCFLTLSLIFLRAGHHAPVWLKFLLTIVAPLAMAGYTLLIGYVYGDARRRGMRYVMWTLLAIFLANEIGVILYFILRDPLLVYCSRCGVGVQPSHAFCPRCGAGVQPACPGCHRTVQPGWTHCAWCGIQL